MSAYLPAPVDRTVEELTGHPARTFAAWATENAAAVPGTADRPGAA
ncbi:hypothetical protein OG204_21690 [Streptomyces sp. NBC_01387]|nr:hypothetical protein [Streptomyces sp. NBC_01267]